VSQDRYSFSGEVAQAPQQQAPSYVAYPSYTEQTNYAAQTKSWEDNTAPVYGTTKPTYTTYSVGTPSVRGARGRGRGESRGRGRGAGRGASTGTWSSAGRGGSDRGRGGARGRGGRGGERGGRGGRGGWNSDGGDFKRMYPKKKNEGPWTASGKHPMMALMEFKPGTVFEEVTRTQCVKTKIWTIKMSCNVEGRAFEGSGVTVKIAKAEAAIQALRALNVNGVYTMLPHIPEKEKSKIERLNQNSLTVALIPATIPSIPAKKMKYNNDPSVDPQVTVPQPDENLPTPETHPIMFVNQTYGPDIKTEFEIVNDQTRPPIFRCTMVVQGTTFIEMGPSKKKARHSCAEICLARFKQNPPPVVNVTKPKEERKTKRGEREKIVVVTGPLTFEDKLLDRCYQELSVISKDLNPRYIKMRNFAAVIVKDGAGEDLEKCETVVMATGTSCVYLENMKPDGSIVHDCTADSLARRGLKLYLYDELAKAVEGKVSIFRETGTRQNKKFSLKPTISLILLKNVAPGGDGRVNKGTSEKQEMMNLNRKRKFEETAKPGEEVPFELKPYIDGSLHVFFNRKETTIPPYQVLKGQTPHVIASPCDKIALHNICGYQGALLSHFVEPVYITTFGIKALYNEEILKRAFYDRIATVSGISGVTQIPHHSSSLSLQSCLSKDRTDLKHSIQALPSSGLKTVTLKCSVFPLASVRPFLRTSLKPTLNTLMNNVKLNMTASSLSVTPHVSPPPSANKQCLVTTA